MKIIFFLLGLIHSTIAYTKCISIYGLETLARNFVCAWVHPVEFYVKELKRLNFTMLRLPFSYQYVQENNFAKMDEFFSVAEKYNMSINLDMHRVWSDHQGPQPEEGITLNEFIAKGWFPVLDRYVNHTSLIGHNIYNEYVNSDIPYIVSYSERVLLAVEQRYPKRFTYFVTGYIWSSSLQDFDLDRLPFSNRIKYSIHRYVWHGSNETDWDKVFGSHLDQVVVGEFGFRNNDKDMTWARKFIAYLKRKNIQDACYWTIAHSSDTDGLWYDNCDVIDWEKYKVLDQLWH
jgi:hypothetical protein